MKTLVFLIKVVVNIAIIVILFKIFNGLGWMEFNQSGSLRNLFSPENWVNSLIYIGIISVLAVTLSTIRSLHSKYKNDISFAAMVVMVPFLYYFQMMLIGMTLGIFTLTTTWWQAAIIGNAFGFLQLSYLSSEKKVEKDKSWSLSYQTANYDPLPRPAQKTKVTGVSNKNFDFCRSCGTKVFPTDRRCTSCGDTQN